MAIDASQRTQRTGVRAHTLVASESRPIPLRAGLSPDRDIEPGMVDRDRFYAEFAPLVNRLIRQYGQNAEIRDDLSGEIYCRFCALLAEFDPARGVPLRPYLIRQLALSTHSYARRQWRIQKREANWEFEESRVEARAAFDPTPEWLAGLEQDQIATLLPVALENLPVRQRHIVMLRYYEERSFEEIAERLSIRPTTVRSLLRHGLNNLRKVIRPPGREGDHPMKSLK